MGSTFPPCLLIFLLSISTILAATEFKCASTTAPIAFSTNLDLTTLTPAELSAIGDCTADFGFPTDACADSDVQVARQVACVVDDIVQADSTNCIDGAVTEAPGDKTTQFACNYFCSSQPITTSTDLSALTRPTDYDVCTGDNFFPPSSCRSAAELTRTVFCARNGTVQGSTCTTPNTLTAPASTAANDPSDCVYFFFCANTNDEWVECNTPSLLTELCAANPFDPVTQTCTPNPTDPTKGIYELPYTTQCAVGKDCKDTNGNFDQSECTDIYQFQTTNKPCTDAGLESISYPCECTPQAEYKCALTMYTIQDLQTDPSRLVHCDNDALFPEVNKIQACSDTTAKASRSIVCVGIDQSLTIMTAENIKDNTTPCAALTLPAQTKDYPGLLDCTYALKCASYNETTSIIDVNSPDCTPYNTNLPSPCFTAPQIDLFTTLTDPSSSISAVISSDFTYQSQLLADAKTLASASEMNFCNADNKRMTQDNGYQHRLQRCIATIEETALDGSTVITQLDPAIVAYDQTCKLAPNYPASQAPREESCCSCKIGYSSGWTSPQKTDDGERPYNQYNNCRMCSSYGTFVLPQPSEVVVGLLLGDLQTYNAGVQKLIDAKTEHLTLTILSTESALWDRRQNFLAQFYKELQSIGGFESSRVNPIYIEPRFISLVGDANSLYNTDSHRRDDYIAKNGDLVLIATFSGICTNGKGDSLSQTYSPWNTIREDLALPKVPYNPDSEDESWDLPFNPLGVPLSEIVTKQTQADAVRARLQSTGSIESSLESAQMGTQAFDFDLSFGGKNQSVLYNAKIFTEYFITNVTTQAMYSPTCSNYYSCPRGRTPFIRSIDDVDLSLSMTHAVILISLAVLLINIAFILYCCLAVTATSRAKSYQPQCSEATEDTPMLPKQKASDQSEEDIIPLDPPQTPSKDTSEVELQTVDG